MTDRIAFRLILGEVLFLGYSAVIGFAGTPQKQGAEGSRTSPSQNPTASREVFEVASVRPSHVAPTGGRGGPSGACGGGGVSRPQIQPSRFIATTTLYALISWAYGKNCVDVVANDLLSGGPQWVRSDQFEIQALIPPGTPQYTVEQLDHGDAPKLQMMLHSLLADRFNLALHSESHDVQAYALTVDKNGARLRPFKEGSCDSTKRFNPQWLSLPREQWPCGTAKLVIRETLTSLEGVDIDLAQFSNLVTAALGRKPVIDKTGLTGKFDVHLEFANDGTTPGALAEDRDVPGAPARARDPSGPSIFTVIEQELGLKLQPIKAPTERLVIDHVDRPTEN
jgi:uncharacterized protein (TIGR03435 family)